MPEEVSEITPLPQVLAELNRTIHEPARLAILTVLAACSTADFLFLEFATGLSRGNLSVQLTRLAEAGFIGIEKTIERKRTLTMVALTAAGRTELTRYWAQMDRVRKHATRPQTFARNRIRRATPKLTFTNAIKPVPT
jgi:DNA-binding transcriptional ArsR family regulator